MHHDSDVGKPGRKTFICHLFVLKGMTVELQAFIIDDSFTICLPKYVLFKNLYIRVSILMLTLGTVLTLFIEEEENVVF
jgi:hypothetical protein